MKAKIMIVKASFVLVLSALFVFQTGCVSTGRDSMRDGFDKKSAENTKSKAGSKISSSDPKLTSDSSGTEQQASVERNQLVEFMSRHSDSFSPVTDSDEVLLSGISNPRSRSLEEAVLVLGLIKKSMNPFTKSENFEEEDLYGQSKRQEQIREQGQEQNTATIGNETSLEALANGKQINLPYTLNQNPFLKSYGVNKMALLALSRSKNSLLFVKKVRAVVAIQVDLWANLQKNHELDMDSTELFSNMKNLNIENQMKSAFESFSAADLRSSDSLLIEAQHLADNKRYRDAITKAGLIQENNPLFPSAQDKIISFSNLAVQELRQRAAQAFQNAIPVSDTKSRAAYLEEAQKHLEEALSNYPKAPADQLSTVRENLAVITRDLERLEMDTTEEE